MKHSPILASLAGLFGHSLAEPVRGSYDKYSTSGPINTCHDSLARCFDSHLDAAVAYCSGLPDITSVQEQTVTETITVIGSSELETTTAASNSLSSQSKTYFPPVPYFGCGKCYRAARFLSACACVGVPQRTNTVVSLVTSTETVRIEKAVTITMSTTSLFSVSSSISSYDTISIDSTSIADTTSPPPSSSTSTMTSTAVLSSTVSSSGTISIDKTSITSPSIASTSSPPSSISASMISSITISSSTPELSITDSPTASSSSIIIRSTTSFSSLGPIVTDEAYIDTVLRHHNIHRANSSSPALTWSPSLAATARTISEGCIYGHNTTVNGGGYSQNIGVGFPSNTMGVFITMGLYNPEVPAYTYYGGEPDSFTVGQWGPYTQIVWKATTSIGCYTNDCSAQGLANAPGIPPYFTVCNYAPAGNLLGAFGQNVVQPLGFPSIDQTYGCKNQPNPDINCIGSTT